MKEPVLLPPTHDSLLDAFRIYLNSLGLSSISRKLYSADIARLLSSPSFANLTLASLSNPTNYLSHLSQPDLASSPTLLRRSVASLKQFGLFLTHRFGIDNPTKNLTVSTNQHHLGLSPTSEKYIKECIEYLKDDHLSETSLRSYKSDITQYLTYLESHHPSTHIATLLNQKNLQIYTDLLTHLQTQSKATIERKTKTIRRFINWYENSKPKVIVSDNHKIAATTLSRTTLSTNVWENTPNSASTASENTPTSLSTPEARRDFVKISNYRKLKLPSLKSALGLIILLLFVSTLSIFSYRQFGRDATLTAAFPSTPVTPNRQLSFQGRLENASGTPITSATNFVFKLFDASSSGTELYSSGTCSITPDTDGVFSTQIGGTCGSGITSSVFTENADVWLEVTVAAETLTPRQQIATVAYALNSETIQGFPISATVSAIKNTVVPMNQWGEIIVGEQSPRLTGVAGTFQISAPSLSLVTATGTNGNITLAPDGTGQINFQGNTTTTNFFNVSNAQLTTGSLITGTVANNNTGFNLIDLFSGSSPTSKFSVTDAGNVTLAGDLTITGDDLFMNTNTSGYLLIADGTNYNPTAMSGDITINSSGVTTIGADKITESMLKAVNSPTDELCLSYESTVGDFEWQACGGGSGSNWRIGSGALSPNNDTLDLLIGSNATSSAKFAFTNINSGTPTFAMSNQASNIDLINSTINALNIESGLLSFDTQNSRIGIGTTAPTAKLDITGTTDVKQLVVRANGTQTANLQDWQNSSGTPLSYIRPQGNLVFNNTITARDGSNRLSNLSNNATLQPEASTTLAAGIDSIINYSGGIGIQAYGGNYDFRISNSTTYGNYGAHNPVLGGVKSLTRTTAGTPTIQGGLAGMVSQVSVAAGTTFSGANAYIAGLDIPALVNSGTAPVNTYGVWIGNYGISGATNSYGIYLDAQTGATNNYGIYSAGGINYFAGNTGIGDSTPDHTLDINGNLGLTANGYINWGDTTGTSGYGFRDNSGTIQFKNSAGSWADIGTGASTWTDAGTYLYPTSAEVLGNSTSGGANKLAGIYLADSSPLVFGTDNDISFSFSGSTLGSTLNSGSMIGINTSTALATLDVRSSLGTIPTASISGNTSMATLVVDQSGTGDLFTASKSGDTKFVITNAGNVGIGVTAPTSKLEIGGATSTISNSSGDITLNAASNFISFAGDSIGNLLNGYFSGEIGLGLADAIGRFHVQGFTVGKALVILDELGDQDLLTASASGLTRARLTNAGSLSLDGDYLNFGLTDGTSGYGFRDNGGTLQFKHNSGSWADIGSGGASWWDQTLGTLQPYNKTVDLLLGGTATTSAKIALININSGTPTATISAGTSGGIYVDATGKIATTAKQTLALGDSSTTGNIILRGGNVGVGVASPTEKLEVDGYVVAQRFVDSASSTYYLDPASTGTSLSIDGNIVGNGAFYLSTGSDAIAVSIGTTGAGKLDAGTIDPPYTINGEKFATYMSSMTGVKEETTGSVNTNEYIAGKGYRATLDFAGALKGSDLWLFSQTSNLSSQLDKLVVLTTAAGMGKTWYEMDAHAGKLYLYAQSPTRISYRLTAPRFDAETWTNSRDSESLGFVINPPTTWSVSNQIASLYNQISDTISHTLTNFLSVQTISPLAEGESIEITAPVTIIPTTQDPNLPTLIVDGEIEATTISARLAQLESIQAEKITAKNIVADTIEANHIIGLDAKIASLSALTDEELASVTTRIKDRLSTLLSPATAEDLPEPIEVADSDSNLDFSSPATHSATLISADIDFATINQYLAVIGQATITTLDVTNNLYVSSIDSKNGILALQPLGGIINLANNTLIVDSNTGTIGINGNLVVNGSILADKANLNQLELGTPANASSSALGNLLAIYNEQGQTVATINASGSANLASLTTNMITIASSGTASDSGAISSIIGTTNSNSTAGVATLISPNTEITINSPYVTSNSLVYLTPTTNTDNKVLFVQNKNTCPENILSLDPNCTPSFTVGIDNAANSDISFNWWIIELAPTKEDQI